MYYILYVLSVIEESHLLGNVLRVILALIIYKLFFTSDLQINLRKGENAL